MGVCRSPLQSLVAEPLAISGAESRLFAVVAASRAFDLLIYGTWAYAVDEGYRQRRAPRVRRVCRCEPDASPRSPLPISRTRARSPLTASNVDTALWRGRGFRQRSCTRRRLHIAGDNRRGSMSLSRRARITTSTRPTSMRWPSSTMGRSAVAGAAPAGNSKAFLADSAALVKARHRPGTVLPLLTAIPPRVWIHTSIRAPRTSATRSSRSSRRVCSIRKVRTCSRPSSRRIAQPGPSGWHPSRLSAFQPACRCQSSLRRRSPCGPRDQMIAKRLRP